MNGAKKYGIDMLTRLSLVGFIVLLCSCGMMPGMDNPNPSSMRTYNAPGGVEVRPTLIPITPSLIADQKISTYDYRVARADVLHITVWQHPEFSIESPAAISNTPGTQGAAGLPGYLVNAKGDLYFPMIGYIHVEHKTVDHIREDISQRLKKYVPNPQVNVRVADFRGHKIYVLGEVEKVGFLPLTDQRLSLADALSLSGWLDPDTADPRYIYIIRGNFTHPRIYWLNAQTPDKLLLAEHFSMQPKDVLYVSSAPAARWNRSLNQLLPTIQAIWYTQAVVRNA